MLLTTLKDITVPIIQRTDPTYADDFWAQEGYAGSEQSELGKRLRAALVQFNSTIKNVWLEERTLTTKFMLNRIPESIAPDTGLGFYVFINSTWVPFSGHLDISTRTVRILDKTDEMIRQALIPGARIQLDNRWYLAAHTFHRHQLPPIESGYYAYDYLRDETGIPRYPQRHILLGPLIASSTAGGATHSGDINMKMFLMDNLLDHDAYPWHADWYKNQVLKAKGGLDEHFRLYFSENTDHTMGRIEGPIKKHVVEFVGLYEQHLRDLSAWVERGIEPPPPTNYTVNNGQVEVPSSASQRYGIQPTVSLTSNGAKRVRIRPGDSVEFTVLVETPKGAGQIVSLEWDPTGVGIFTKINVDVASIVAMQIFHTFADPGEYFAGIRVASHREGRTDTGIALASNLDRMRVVVEGVGQF
jgi:hypothetical protein